MLPKLSPDDLLDIGDFIQEMCELCDKNMEQREMLLPDVCFSLIFLGMDIAYDAGYAKKDVERLAKQILRLINEKRKGIP